MTLIKWNSSTTLQMKHILTNHWKINETVSWLKDIEQLKWRLTDNTLSKKVYRQT